MSANPSPSRCTHERSGRTTANCCEEGRSGDTRRTLRVSECRLRSLQLTVCTFLPNIHGNPIVSMPNFEIQPGKLKPYGTLPVPRLTPELLTLVKTGTVHSLAVIYREGIPVPSPMVPYSLSARIRHGDLKEIAPASAAAEAITMSCHTGTHMMHYVISVKPRMETVIRTPRAKSGCTLVRLKRSGRQTK
jgi:hypothetical protein